MKSTIKIKVKYVGNYGSYYIKVLSMPAAYQKRGRLVSVPNPQLTNVLTFQPSWGRRGPVSGKFSLLTSGTQILVKNLSRYPALYNMLTNLGDTEERIFTLTHLKTEGDLLFFSVEEPYKKVAPKEVGVNDPIAKVVHKPTPKDVDEGVRDVHPVSKGIAHNVAEEMGKGQSLDTVHQILVLLSNMVRPAQEQPSSTNDVGKALDQMTLLEDSLKSAKAEVGALRAEIKSLRKEIAWLNR